MIQPAPPRRPIIDMPTTAPPTKSTATAAMIAMPLAWESMSRSTPSGPERLMRAKILAAGSSGAVQRVDLGRVLLGDRLALELHGRRDLFAARLPRRGQQPVRLDLLDARQACVAALHGGVDVGPDALVLDELGDVGREPVLGEPRGRLGVEDDERRHVRPRVADRDDLPDERALLLDRALDVRRRHVLAGAVDDELLLAIDDLEVAVLVAHGDVAGMEPPVLVDRLTRALGILAVVRQDAGPSNQDLAIVGELDLDAGDRGPDRAELDARGRVARAQQALRHSPELGDRHTDGMEELQHGVRRRSGC